MALAHAVSHVDEIEMGIDLDDMDRPMLAEGADAGDVDRMIAAQHHRKRATLEQFPHSLLGIGVALGGVGMNDIGITDIDDAHLVERKIGNIVLMVISAAMAEGEERRGFADGAGSKARARA